MQPIDFDRFLDMFELSDEAFGVIVGRRRAQIRLWRTGAERIPYEIALIARLMTEFPDAVQIAKEHAKALQTGGPTTREVVQRGLGAKLMKLRTR